MEDTTYVNSSIINTMYNYSAAQRDVHKKGTRLLNDFSICLNGGCLVFCALLLASYATLSKRNMEESHLLCSHST